MKPDEEKAKMFVKGREVILTLNMLKQIESIKVTTVHHLGSMNVCTIL